jgi:hypothetical protein
MWFAHNYDFQKYPNSEKPHLVNIYGIFGKIAITPGPGAEVRDGDFAVPLSSVGSPDGETGRYLAEGLLSTVILRERSDRRIS